MTILWGDTGRTVYGPLKTFNFSFATPRETALGTLTLPNAEGTTNQSSFTIQSSDLPIITPSALITKYNACLIVSGKCGASATTINYRVLKNGASVVTANTTHTAGQYWTQNHWRTFDVTVGDVIEVRNWANVTDATVDYCALIIYPHAYLSKSGTFLRDVTTGSSITPSLTGAGVRTTSATANSYYSFTPTSNATVTLNVSGAITVYGLMPNTTTGTIRINYGDSGGLQTNNSSNATSIAYQRNYLPQTVTFREILR